MSALKDTERRKEGDDPGSLPGRPELRAWHDALKAIADDARRLTEGLSDEALHWTPPGTNDPWSIARCLDHLNKTGYLLLPKMEEAIRQGKARGFQETVGGPVRGFNIFERYFIGLMQPGAKTKVPVPPVFAPDPRPASDTLPRFLTLQERLGECIIAADGLDLARIKVTSAANRLLRMSLGAWLEATVAHERYHLLQARAVRENPGLPSS